jgi:hypothetical protein
MLGGETGGDSVVEFKPVAGAERRDRVGAGLPRPEQRGQLDEELVEAGRGDDGV